MLGEAQMRILLHIRSLFCTAWRSKGKSLSLPSSMLEKLLAGTKTLAKAALLSSLAILPHSYEQPAQAQVQQTPKAQQVAPQVTKGSDSSYSNPIDPRNGNVVFSMETKNILDFPLRIFESSHGGDSVYLYIYAENKTTNDVGGIRFTVEAPSELVYQFVNWNSNYYFSSTGFNPSPEDDFFWGVKMMPSISNSNQVTSPTNAVRFGKPKKINPDTREVLIRFGKGPGTKGVVGSFSFYVPENLPPATLNFKVTGQAYSTDKDEPISTLGSKTTFRIVEDYDISDSQMPVIQDLNQNIPELYCYAPYNKTVLECAPSIDSKDWQYLTESYYEVYMGKYPTWMPITYRDVDAVNYPSRFYRVRVIEDQ